MITVLAGGVGAARYLSGLQRVVPPSEITAIVNTADDTVLHGLAISPDLDTVTYTLAGLIDPERGWGLVDESWRAMGALDRFTAHRPEGSAAGGTWFNLGDQDLATHLYRTGRLAEGATLTAVTAEITAAFGLGLRLLPMTDDTVGTIVTVARRGRDHVPGVLRRPPPRRSGQRRPLRRRRDRAARSGRRRCAPLGRGGGDRAVEPDRVDRSDSGTRRRATTRSRGRRDTVVAVSPIVAGAALKGPADRMLAELGHEASVVGVARLYAPICGCLVIDRADEGLAGAVEREGLRCVVTDTIMRSPDVADELARTTLAAVRR